MKTPKFYFFPDNYEGGTDDFTLEEDGAYLRLLILQFREGRFTKARAIQKLRQRGVIGKACERLWNKISPKLMNEGDVFWSERLAHEMENARRKSEQASAAAYIKHSKNDASAQTIASASNNASASASALVFSSGDGGQGEGVVAWISKDAEYCAGLMRRMGITKEQFDHRFENFRLDCIEKSRNHPSKAAARAGFEKWLNSWMENEKIRGNGLTTINGADRKPENRGLTDAQIVARDARRREEQRKKEESEAKNVVQCPPEISKAVSSLSAKLKVEKVETQRKSVREMFKERGHDLDVLIEKTPQE